MKLKLVQIGNSVGIRIPQSLLQQYKFKKEVIVTIVDGKLVLSPIDEPRKDWEESFKKIAQTGDDTLLDSEVIESTFDNDEWKW